MFEMEKASKKFFMDEWGDARILLHSECVIASCLGMAMDTDLDVRIFVMAGYLHDLGIKIDKEKHNVLSMDFLERFFQLFPGYVGLRAEIADCILNHRSEGKPATVYGIIFQAADKAALHKREWLDFKAQK